MTVKPAVLALLAVGGLGAAGVGGYLAVSSTVPPAPVATEASAPVAPAVSETEAIVAPTEPVEAPAGTVPVKEPDAAPRPTSRERTVAAGSARPARQPDAEPVEAPRATAPAPVRRSEPRAPAATPAPRPAPPATDARSSNPPAPAVARDESSRPASEPAREPASTGVEGAREPLRQTDESRASAEPPAPRIQEFVVPADSVIGLRLEDSISTDTARIEQPVDARVTRDVRVNGTVVIPSGTRARGEVTLVEPGGRFKERARLGIRFHTLVLADGSTVPIETETLYREGDEVGRKAATRIGASAVGGAIVGAIFGGGRGAAIGAAAGAGAGTAATAAGQRSTATLPSGSTVTIRLTGPATVALEP
jgi:hypothetical protein